MAKASDCPFCNLRERVLKQNKTAQAFLSNPRKVPGHFLVTPKRHVEKPWELTKAELQDIFELLFFIEQRLIGKLGDGVDIRQNYRPFMKQSRLKKDHVHFHVYPRYLEDYLYKVSEKFETDLFTDLDENEQDEFAKLLK
ncbi:MAG TPA: HIT domain-containing protein [Patescibacteria group bacterium]|nr:HIT domain-containing protein [Patescibacteria group bacterium]